MNFKANITKFKDKVLDLIFPNDIKCIFCDRDIPEGDICQSCEQVIFNLGSRCEKCDTPIKDGNVVCDHCKREKRAFVKAICPLVYKDDVRSAILKFKDDSAKYLAKPFAKIIFDRPEKENIQFDIIVPIPSHPKTIKRRGYNPALLIAQELGALTNKPVEDILVKTVITKTQKLLNYQDRQTNLENSLTLSNNKLVKNKNVLIVDDIITTCATINACAALMHKANSVYACAVARRAI